MLLFNLLLFLTGWRQLIMAGLLCVTLWKFQVKTFYL